jgi:hypothetical protein
MLRPVLIQSRPFWTQLGMAASDIGKRGAVVTPMTYPTR